MPERDSSLLRDVVLRGIVAGVLFVILAAATFDHLPLSAHFGESSTLGIRPLREALGGVDRVGVAISRETVNSVLDMDAATKQAWVDASAPRERWNPDDPPPTPSADEPERPETWPLEGRLGRGAGAALAILSTLGIDVVTRHVEIPNVLVVEPLALRLDRSSGGPMIGLLAALLAAILVGPRSPASVANSMTVRLLRGAGCGAVATMAAMFLAVGLLPASVPRLTPEWQAYVGRLVELGRITEPELLTAENTRTLQAFAGCFVASSMIGALVRR